MLYFDKPNIFLLTTKPHLARGTRIVSKISVPELPRLSLAAPLPQGTLKLSHSLRQHQTSQVKLNITLRNASLHFIKYFNNELWMHGDCFLSSRHCRCVLFKAKQQKRKAKVILKKNILRFLMEAIARDVLSKESQQMG